LGDDDMKELRNRYKMEENTEEETPTQEEELANSNLPTIAL